MIDKYLWTYYNQDWVYTHIKEYFKIEELVAPKVIAKYGEEQCWSFLDFRLLSNLLFIRIELNKAITANYGGDIQRGLRSILSKIVLRYFAKGKLYLSGHVRGTAVDFDVENMTAEEVRYWIVQHHGKLPFKCRLEWKKNNIEISWIHMDVDYFPNHPKVYLFNV